MKNLRIGDVGGHRTQNSRDLVAEIERDGNGVLINVDATTERRDGTFRASGNHAWLTRKQARRLGLWLIEASFAAKARSQR